MPIDRRKFLIGTGALAAGGATALGSGAFSRVESQRVVSIEVARDDNAYLGFKLLDTPNSNNYVDYDENGHIQMHIGEHDDFSNSGPAEPGEGVNSDSFTWFDGLFKICNQGKADAVVSYVLPDPPSERDIGDDWEAPDPDYDEQVVAFYYIERDNAGNVTNRRIIHEGEELALELGECSEIGVRTVTKGVDATVDAPLIDGEVVVTAVSEDAGSPTNG